MVDLVFYQVLFLNTLTRHYDIVIVFPCLYHRLIQYLIDPPFLYLLFLYRTLYLHLSHLHLQLLLSSPLSLLICIDSLRPFIHLCTVLITFLLAFICNCYLVYPYAVLH